MNNKELIKRIDTLLNSPHILTPELLLADCKKALQDSESKILARDAELDSLQKLLYIKNEEINRLKSVNTVKYQYCPVCNGHGRVLADGFISAVYKTCEVCNGSKIIPEAKLSEQVDPIELIDEIIEKIESMKGLSGKMAMGEWSSKMVQLLEGFKKESC